MQILGEVILRSEQVRPVSKIIVRKSVVEIVLEIVLKPVRATLRGHGTKPYPDKQKEKKGGTTAEHATWCDGKRRRGLVRLSLQSDTFLSVERPFTHKHQSCTDQDHRPPVAKPKKNACPLQMPSLQQQECKTADD